MLTDKQIIEKYGQPGDISSLTVLKLPYPMRIAWDTKATVQKMQCHKLVAPNFQAVFEQLLEIYQLPKIQELGIDLFGGCVNLRTMRGSKTKWSRHAWGIAIDLDPARNGLKTKWPNAQFAKPEYKEMLAIFKKNGFISYGADRGYDAMHFEIGQ